MASFRKRAGRWQARVHQSGQSAVVKTFASKDDAQRWARAVERELDLGIYTPRTEAEGTTVAELVARYISEVVPSMKGADSESYRLRNIVRLLGRIKVSALTPTAMASYRDKRLKLVRGSTVLRELNSFSGILTHASKEWAMGITNPVAGIRKPAASRGRTRRLDDGEELKLMAALECRGRNLRGQLAGGTRNHWIKPVVQLALATAMRRGELLALEWRFVNLEQKIVHLPDTKNGRVRNVPLSRAACEVLRTVPRAIDGRVFPITADSLKQAFKRAVVSAGLEDFHFHDLRHEATSRMAQRLPNLIELASVTGHQDLRMLQRYYHPNPAELAVKLG